MTSSRHDAGVTVRSTLRIVRGARARARLTSELEGFARRRRARSAGAASATENLFVRPSPSLSPAPRRTTPRRSPRRNVTPPASRVHSPFSPRGVPRAPPWFSPFAPWSGLCARGTIRETRNTAPSPTVYSTSDPRRRRRPWPGPWSPTIAEHSTRSAASFGSSIADASKGRLTWDVRAGWNVDHCAESCDASGEDAIARREARARRVRGARRG